MLKLSCGYTFRRRFCCIDLTVMYGSYLFTSWEEGEKLKFSKISSFRGIIIEQMNEMN